MIRYWYTIIGAAGLWEMGWTFGDTPEAAAASAVERETKFHPIRMRARPLRVCLQSVPDYGREHLEPTQYRTVVIEENAHVTARSA
jgi:hypothetical protein